MKRHALPIALVATALNVHAAEREPSIATKPCESMQPPSQARPIGTPPQFRIGGTTPFGHREAPSHVAVDPKGELLLTHGDGRLRVWDLRTGAPVRDLRAPLRRADARSQVVSYSYPCVIDTGFSTNGQAIFAADVEGISLWTRTGAERSAFVPWPLLADRDLLPDPRGIRYAASGDGRYVAVVWQEPVNAEREMARARARGQSAEDSGSRIAMIDARTGKVLRSERLPVAVTAVAFTHAGDRILAGGERSRAHAGNAVLVMLATERRGFAGDIATIDLGRLPTPESIAPVAGDAEVLVFARRPPGDTGKLVRVRLSDGALALAADPSNTRVRAEVAANRVWAAVSPDGRLAVVSVAVPRRWGVAETGLLPVDIATGDVTVKRGPLDFGAEAVVASPNGRYLVAWPSDPSRDAVLVDIPSKAITGTLPQSAARFVRAQFDPRGQRLHAVHYDAVYRGSLVTFDMSAAPRLLRSVPLEGDTSEIAVSPDGEWVAINTRKPHYQGMLDAGGVIEVRRASSLELAFTMPQPPRVERRQLVSLQFAPDAPALYVAESWDVLSGVESSRRRVDKVHRIAVPGFAIETFDRPGLSSWPLWVVTDRTIVAREADRVPRFVTVNLSTGAHAWKPGPGGYLDVLDRSRSGRLVAYSLASGEIHVQDAFGPGTVIALAVEGCSSLRMARFASDDSMLFAACGNGALVGWKL